MTQSSKPLDAKASIGAVVALLPHLIKALVEKRIFTGEEALKIVRDAGNGFSLDDPAEQAQVKAVLSTLFPKATF
jgi:hypothetical protein